MAWYLVKKRDNFTLSIFAWKTGGKISSSELFLECLLDVDSFLILDAAKFYCIFVSIKCSFRFLIC
jgi:hypothetical protein